MAGRKRGARPQDTLREAQASLNEARQRRNDGVARLAYRQGAADKTPNNGARSQDSAVVDPNEPA